MARPIAETFRESVSHVDFFENDLVLTEDVAMPDSEVGLEYSAYVERVENRLDRAVKDVVSARGDDLDLAYASSHGDDVLSSISRDLANRFLGDNLGAEGDVGLSDVERSGNGWLRDGLKDGLSEQLFDMIRWSRMGDRDDVFGGSQEVGGDGDLFWLTGFGVFAQIMVRGLIICSSLLAKPKTPGYRMIHTAFGWACWRLAPDVA